MGRRRSGWRNDRFGRPSYGPPGSLQDALAARFDARARARGHAYAGEGRVEIVDADPDGVEANVFGSRREPYQVSVSINGDEAAFSCDCPAFASLGPCKHCWAVVVEMEDGSDWDGESLSEFTVPPPRPSAPPRPPRWTERLAHLEAVYAATPSADGHAGGDRLRFLIHPRAIRETEQVCVAIERQRPLKAGGYGAPRPFLPAPEAVAGLPDPADRTAVRAVLGGDSGAVLLHDALWEQSRWWPGSNGRDLFPVDWGDTRRVLEACLATGRCFAWGAPDEQPSPVVRDAGGPWMLRLAVEPEGDEVVLRATLARGDADRPLEAATILHSEGWALLDGRFVDWGPARALPWVGELRSGPITARGSERDALIERLLAIPSLPAVALPPPWEVRAPAGPPTPVLRVARPLGDEPEIEVTVAFAYGDALVEDAGALHRVAGKTAVLARDAEAEAVALERLDAAGVTRAWRTPDNRRGDVAVADLPRVVQTLLAEGWRVEAEGRPLRAGGATHVRVRSGKDWFDLEGGADFDGVVAPLPALLQARAEGRRFVTLGDGSVGLLPEDWLARQAPWLALGTPVEGAVRFAVSQGALLDALLAALPAVDVDARFAEYRRRLREFEGLTPAEAPAGFTGTLRPYQAHGLAWLRFLRDFRLGGCLADDMGLGKGVQVLALLVGRSRARGEPRPALVVAPKSVVPHWCDEARRFAPSLVVREYGGAGRAALLAALDDVDLLVTSYGVLRRDAPRLATVRFDTVVLDEAQAIKNAGTGTAKAARLLAADHRLACTGTPVENRIEELWSLLEFLNPGMLGRARSFRDLTRRGVGVPDPGALEPLAATLRPILLRRTKAQVAADLPPRTEDTIEVTLLPAQRRLYDELRDHYRRSLLARVETQGMERARMHVLEALLRLRQAACHPALVNRAHAAAGSAKLDELLPRLEELAAEGNRALVFSQFTSLLALVRERLDAAGMRYAYLDGRTRDRAARVAEFQADDGPPLFLISLKAGGTGLNLTAAGYVFLLDPWWNPAVEAQAIDRTHRIGQQKPVFAYRLIAADTVESRILEMQADKRALADAILREDRGPLAALTREDLERLLG